MEKNTKIIIAIVIIILALVLFGKNLNLGTFSIGSSSSSICNSDSDCNDGSNIIVRCINPGTTASLCLAPGEGERNLQP